MIVGIEVERVIEVDMMELVEVAWAEKKVERCEEAIEDVETLEEKEQCWSLGV